MNRTSKLLVTLIIILTLFMVLPTRVRAQDSPAIKTDKADYSPGETVTITGVNFEPSTSYSVIVVRPAAPYIITINDDGSVNDPGWGTAKTDESGSFTYLYRLDGVEGTYTVNVYSSSWTPNSDETPIATTTFTDSQPGADLSVSFTDGAHYTRTFGWTIEKSVTPSTWDLFSGDSGTSEYTVTLTKDAGTDRAWIDGIITVTNNGDVDTQDLAIQVKIKITGNGSPAVNVDPISVDLGSNTVLSALGGYADYSYSVDVPVPPRAGAGVNYAITVTASASNNQGNNNEKARDRTDPFGAGPTLIYDTIHVTDTNGGSWTFSASGTQTYPKTFTADDEGDNKNTATITETSQSADAMVTVNIYSLEVTKDASTSFKRTYGWSIDKSADTDEVHLGVGTTSDVGYSIKVDTTGYTDSDYAVSGNIHVHNPAPIPAVIKSVSDLVSPDIVATVNFGITFPYTLIAGETLSGTYSASLPDYTSRTNTATATLQNYDYNMVWDISGNYVIHVYYGGTYAHDFVLSMTSNGIGFAGTGGYPAGGPYSITEAINGFVLGDSVSWHSTYDGSSYYWNAVGAIASDGTLSGIWSDNSGIGGNWASFIGAATKLNVLTGTVSSGTTDYSGTASVDFSSATITEVDKSVTVYDSFKGTLGTLTVGTDTLPKTYTYTRTIGPYTDLGTYYVDNTASVKSGDTTITSDDQRVTVYVEGSEFVAVTSKGFQDIDTFKLIFTPDVPSYPSFSRLTASNPGQFSFNVFYDASAGQTFTIKIPYPFVTQGANPVLIYNSAPNVYNPTGSVINSQFTTSGTPVTINSYIGTKTFGDTATITVKDNNYNGPMYITIHLDYGLKKIAGDYSKNLALDATKNTGSAYESILNNQKYTFSVTTPFSAYDSITNTNVFKNDPGIGGLVLDKYGAPVAGVNVQIYQGKTQMGALTTDADGWYMWNYKWTGKAVTFTVKVPAYNLSTDASLKANGFLVVSFALP